MMPAETLRGAEPEIPMRNRHTRMEAMEGASAQPSCNKKKLDKLTIITGLRPTHSLNGAHTMGPMANPNSIRLRPSTTTSVGAPNATPSE